MTMTNLELLSENFVNANNGRFLRYYGFFKHTKIDCDVWKIRISVNTRYNDEDINIAMFMQGSGWVQLATFDDIAGMKSIPHDIKGKDVVDILRENIKLIERWLDIFH